MRPRDRAIARRQLDKRLNPLRNSESFARPPRGWIKAIREALGMTTAQLGRRLGVSQPRAVAIEQAEPRGAITLETLERAAHALDCELVYALVPRNTLEGAVKERALAVAKCRLAATAHSMALEGQSIDDAAQTEQIRQLATELAGKSGSELWDDE